MGRSRLPSCFQQEFFGVGDRPNQHRVATFDGAIKRAYLDSRWTGRRAGARYRVERGEAAVQRRCHGRNRKSRRTRGPVRWGPLQGAPIPRESLVRDRRSDTPTSLRRSRNAPRTKPRLGARRTLIAPAADGWTKADWHRAQRSLPTLAFARSNRGFPAPLSQIRLPFPWPDAGLAERHSGRGAGRLESRPASDCRPE